MTRRALTRPSGSLTMPAAILVPPTSMPRAQKEGLLTEANEGNEDEEEDGFSPSLPSFASVQFVFRMSFET
jgi:hypothetical protein